MKEGNTNLLVIIDNVPPPYIIAAETSNYRSYMLLQTTDQINSPATALVKLISGYHYNTEGVLNTLQE